MASLNSIGILGEKYLDLDPGKPTQGALPSDGQHHPQQDRREPG